MKIHAFLLNGEDIFHDLTEAVLHKKGVETICMYEDAELQTLLQDVLDEFSVAKNVLEMMAGDDETSAYYDEKMDTFIVVFNVSTQPEVEVYAPKTIIYQGEQLKVYPLGSQSWCWDVA